MFSTRSFPTRLRSVVLCAALLLLILAVSLPASAQSSGQAGGAGGAAVRTNKAAPRPPISWSPLPVRLPAFGAAALKPKWLDGAMQSNMDFNCMTGYAEAVTTEFVGYIGMEDATSPKVGDVYYVRAAVADVGGPCAGPAANIELILPPYTGFAIDRTNPVVCSMGSIETWDFKEVAPKDCPQKTRKGTYGWVFNKANGEPWDIKGGKMVIVSVPVVSTKKMSGIASNAYLTGAIQALDGSLDPWDDPNQGVFVADNPPAVQYNKTATTGITATGARLNASVLNHYTAGKAYFEFGTTKQYGTQGEQIPLKADANSYTVYQMLTDLKPNTTYHWRVRFVGANGKVVTGADQTFKTKSR